MDKTDELKTAIAYIGGQIPSVNYKIVKSKKVLINPKNKITWEQAKDVVKRCIN